MPRALFGEPFYGRSGRAFFGSCGVGVIPNVAVVPTGGRASFNPPLNSTRRRTGDPLARSLHIFSLAVSSSKFLFILDRMVYKK